MNYYDIIGVSKNASSEDISAAHKALAKKYHPDVNAGKDAHEKMTMLNTANEILSDDSKRKQYDSYLNHTEQQRKHREIQKSRDADTANRAREIRETEERNEKAAALRKKAEERIKAGNMAQVRTTNRAQRIEDEKTQKFKQARADINKQQVINTLSDLVTDGNKNKDIITEADEERHSATKVLLDMVRKNDDRLKIMAEKAVEAERKQRIEEILSLVNEINSEEEKFV